VNKSELAAAIAAKASITKKDSEKILGATLETIAEALQNNDKVQLVGFGTFEPKKRPARKARNPRTGEPIDIPPTTSASFKAGKTLKESLAK
jgi:DNA-binding protein HU-beta